MSRLENPRLDAEAIDEEANPAGREAGTPSVAAAGEVGVGEVGVGEVAAGEVGVGEVVSREAAERNRALTPPQFGMRTMFILVAVAALVFLAFRTLPPLFSIGIMLLCLSVFAHVAGNALGTRLRDLGDKPIHQDQVPERLESHHFAPTTQLSTRRRLGRPMLILSGLGVVAGSIIGTWLLALANRDYLTLGNIALAAVSCGVLGGIFCFGICSFGQVIMQAWWQAHSGADD